MQAVDLCRRVETGAPEVMTERLVTEMHKCVDKFSQSRRIQAAFLKAVLVLCRAAGGNADMVGLVAQSPSRVLSALVLFGAAFDIENQLLAIRLLESLSELDDLSVHKAMVEQGGVRSVVATVLCVLDRVDGFSDQLVSAFHLLSAMSLAAVETESGAAVVDCMQRALSAAPEPAVTLVQAVAGCAHALSEAWTAMNQATSVRTLLPQLFVQFKRSASDSSVVASVASCASALLLKEKVNYWVDNEVARHSASVIMAMELHARNVKVAVACMNCLHALARRGKLTLPTARDAIGTVASRMNSFRTMADVQLAGCKLYAEVFAWSDSADLFASMPSLYSNVRSSLLNASGTSTSGRELSRLVTNALALFDSAWNSTTLPCAGHACVCDLPFMVFCVAAELPVPEAAGALVTYGTAAAKHRGGGSSDDDDAAMYGSGDRPVKS